MKKALIIILLLSGLIFLNIMMSTIIMNYNFASGELISETTVNLRILSKDYQKYSLFVKDEGSGNMFDMRVNKNIFNIVDMDSVVEGTKKVYKENDGDTKAYYSINTKKYNEASFFDIKNSKEKNTYRVDVEIRDKYKEYYYSGSTRIYNYYVVYKEPGSDYTTTEELSRFSYNSIDINDRLLAIKTEYVLEKDDVVYEYKLLIQ